MPFLGLLSLLAASMAVAEPCKLGRIGELPVTMRDMRPFVHAAINGKDALFLADSGMFFSVLTPAAAKQFNLSLDPAIDILVTGVGGDARAWVTTVKTFTIFGKDLSRIPFYVLGNDLGNGAVGIIGQNVFRIGDVDYDLANGLITLVRTHGDCKKTSLAYWANARDLAYSEIEIDASTVEQPHTIGVAYLNGAKIRVMFDTGADASVITLRAAKRAGITPASPGVTSGGMISGVGRRLARTWIAPFASFKIGDEEIRNTHLRIGEDMDDDTDMLIGTDFFLSHHVLVASSQRRLYFTYNGGPVFNLSTTMAESGDAPAQAAQGSGPDAAAADGTQPKEAQLDADGYARRGSAFASRRDYQHALADLTRAIELDPGKAEYFYERGSAYAADRRADKALEDFTQAIRLEPDHVPALMARARLRADRDDPADAIAPDLDAADRAAPRAGDMRLDLGDLYRDIRSYPAAITQYGYWIDTHNSDDIEMPRAREARCWMRVLVGTGLDQALDDCKLAVRKRPKTADFIESRGFVYLRQGRLDKASADFDAALSLNAKLPWALYGRGLARLRLGQSAAAAADIAAAKALSPRIAEEAASHGIGP
ncbi:MAG TPA: aspartyl protease family protein [Steroidobacteraceae bacterium]|nr:aspartyl protease family protein [Steroidobacteraceae bacterium]